MHLNIAHEKLAQRAPKMLISHRRPKFTYRKASSEKNMCYSAHRAAYTYGSLAIISVQSICELPHINRPLDCVSLGFFFSFCTGIDVQVQRWRANNESEKKNEIAEMKFDERFFGADHIGPGVRCNSSTTSFNTWSPLQPESSSYHIFLDSKFSIANNQLALPLYLLHSHHLLRITFHGRLCECGRLRTVCMCMCVIKIADFMSFILCSRNNDN